MTPNAGRGRDALNREGMGALQTWGVGKVPHPGSHPDSPSGPGGHRKQCVGSGLRLRKRRRPAASSAPAGSSPALKCPGDLSPGRHLNSHLRTRNGSRRSSGLHCWILRSGYKAARKISAELHNQPFSARRETGRKETKGNLIPSCTNRKEQ